MVRRPCAKVSAASRKLKSSGINGSGIGRNGRIARRIKSAERPTVTTAKRFLRANRAKARSVREKKEEPRRGQPNATAATRAARPASITISFGSPAGGDDMSIRILCCNPAMGAVGTTKDQRSHPCFDEGADLIGK